MKTKANSPLLAILQSINPALGEKKRNLHPVDKRTQGRWFRGESTPSVPAVKALAKEIWHRISSPGSEALRTQVFKCIRSVMPSAPCETWSELSFISWFAELAHPSGEDALWSVALDVEVWQPHRGGFVSVQESGVQVKRGSKVRLRVRSSPPAYLHLVWIDSRGQATPLHPWKPGDWAKVNIIEPKDLDPLPADSPGYWTIDTPEGLESVAVAANRKPLDVVTSRALNNIWSGLGARVSVDHLIPGPAFEWQGLPGSFRLSVNTKERDPVLRRVRTVAERLSLYFPYVKILSFVNRG